MDEEATDDTWATQISANKTQTIDRHRTLPGTEQKTATMAEAEVDALVIRAII